MKDDQRVLLTRRLLQEGLLRLLEKKDIDSIRVSELCSESGINRATFYRHYQQPRDILKNMRSNIIEDIRKLAEQNGARTDLFRWLELTCRYYRDHADILQVLFRTRTDDEFVEAIQVLYSKYGDPLEGYMGSGADADCGRLMAYGCAGGCYYILRQWILEPIGKEPREVAAVMYRFLTGREAPPQG